jgi:16S rRNA (cytosine1402-N4)-methyltransferase
MTIIHKSVLVNEVLTYLDPQPGKLYIDATFGAGGHTRAILEREPNCRVVAIDWDDKSIAQFAPPLVEEFSGRLQVVWGNFAHLYKVLKNAKIASFDGILADFGTSQMQIFEREGFSFLVDTPLDMRMSPSHHRQTAADIVNSMRAEDLADIFYQLGGETFSRQIAKAIVLARRNKRFVTTLDLAEVVKQAVPYRAYHKIHPATKVFQALRIYVNKELDNITSFLSSAMDMGNSGARIVCISFHSLEDRIVKEFFKNHPCQVGRGVEPITKKVVTAGDEELAVNPSSRSARLRAAKICIND